MEKVYKQNNEDLVQKTDSDTLNESKKPLLNEEVYLDNDKKYLTTTDVNGLITYCDVDFSEICGYTEWELIGKSHQIFRHPDMPKVMFKLLWSRLKTDNEVTIILKNVTKSGKFYWSISSFTIKKDDDGCVLGYRSYRKPVSKKALQIIIPLYDKLREKEDVKGILAAEEYLIGYLEAKEMMYDTFIEQLAEIKDVVKKEKKSIFDWLK